VTFYRVNKVKLILWQLFTGKAPNS